MNKLYTPFSFIFGLFAVTAFGQWLEGGVIYDHGEVIHVTAPGTGAIIFALLAGLCWFLEKKSHSGNLPVE